jgi:predicted nucleic acid-binding protein
VPDGPLDLVVDASVLVAELLRSSGRARLAHANLALFIPEHTWSEVQYELPRRVMRLAERAGLTAEERHGLITLFFAAVEANVMIVPEAAYAPLEPEARWRIERDPQDWPTVALALALEAAIWTEDRDFLGCGVATWTTATLARLLNGADRDGRAAPPA